MVLLTAGIFFPLPAQSSPCGQCLAERLLAMAREKNLHADRYWHILMHYEKTLTGVESQVDDPDFFLAEDGKTDPEAELHATIRYLFDGGKDAQEAACRFYARFGWLKEELGGELPQCFAGRNCPDIDRIDPRSASLIFPTYYMNNPASMFGHTLIIIDTAYTNKRLSNAVNYAAVTGGGDGFSLALSGLTGLYQGYYSVMPYYKKIQEYSDINQRDIWEYRLNLSPAELRRMVRHIREMDQIGSDYYFFDENCSYNLLYLIEAARPSVHLTDRFDLAAIPIDTIKAVKEEDLIVDAEFRPAKATRIDYLIDQLDSGQVEMVEAMIEGQMAPAELLDRPFSNKEKIRILDLVAEVIQYRYVSEDLDKEDYREQLLSALRVRSGLGQAETDWQEQIPVPPRPENSHDSRRVSAGIGLRSGDVFYELRLRPALTDLTDMDYVHNQGAQIEFGDLRTRYYPESGRLTLEQFDIVDIVSVAPMDAIFKPLSWKFNTGWHRKPLENDGDASYYRVNAGAGVSARVSWLGMCYAMAEAELAVGGDLETDYAVGSGASLGTIFSLGPASKFHLYGQGLGFFAGDTHAEYTAGASGNFRVSPNNHLSVAAEYKDAGKAHYEVLTAWHLFF
ncbi:MAG TPA: DUF4105 domain-containing protein [Desulfosalsimonadaceae bacterium]|nr:DUF4105 domain-containing protein [Desulfosalsimonadaceae bacterium]